MTSKYAHFSEPLIPVGKRTAWILECGCEPDCEYCEQCGARRTVVAQWEKQDKMSAAKAELESAGFIVTRT